MVEIQITREKRLKRLRNYINRMPSLSTTVIKVLRICNNPATSPNELNRVISLDPVLTGQILMLINSAYYSLPNQVTSLTRAIIMLGINTVKNFSLSTAILATLGGKKSFQGLSIDDFWTHSICVGVTAKSLAAIKGVPSGNQEEYFVAGLLHDLGKIPLLNCFPEEYTHVLETVTLEQASLRHTENIMFGIDHCMVGKMIAEKWQLGDAIYNSIYYHHNPEEAGDQNSQLIAIVSLANTCSNIFEIGSSGNAFSDKPVLARLLDKVGVSWATISELRETVLKEIEKAKVFLQITQKG